MRIASLIFLNLLFYLALSSGIAKILQLDREMQFFAETMGMSELTIVVLGSVQLLAGILLMLRTTRLAGAAILLVTFVGSTALIFMSGEISFGLLSLLAIAMAVFVMLRSLRVI